ncbi:MAG: NAD+ synthase [Bacteroidia bacterium]
MRVALAQMNYHTGNFESNTAKIIKAIETAKAEGTDLIVFSEMCVVGYPPRDFLEFDDFIHQSDASLKKIAAVCQGIAAIVGAPTRNPVPKGKDLYNSAILLEDGQVKAVRHKTLLPNYDIFDEYRYFEPNRVFEIVEFKGFRIALTICEDLWNNTDNPLYIINPMDELIRQQPHLMINIAASPFSKVQIEKRRQIMLENVEQYKIPLFYCNLTGAQTQLIFDGGSMVVNADGTIADELNHFIPDGGIYELTIDGNQTRIEVLKKHLQKKHVDTLECIKQALVLGIREYFSKQDLNKAILGMSGGIDSAVVLALAVEALGKDNVKAVLLPSRYSSQHSIDDSLHMVNNLGIQHEIISIEKTFNALEESLASSFKGLPSNLTEENMQSRSRGVILMALCNKFGYILLNTSNKSELAVGYGTLYGDMCGGLSVIGDLYKTEVYSLSRHINKEQELIPENIITKPPSAELRPDQLDSDSLPDYSLLDRILYLYIEERKGPQEIMQTGFDPDLVKRVLRMVNMNEWKRLQAPPVLRVSVKAFGPGRRVPIVAKYLS